MKVSLRLRSSILCLPIILSLAGSNLCLLSASASALSKGEEKQAQEREEAQAFARRFTKRFQETKDLAPLVDEFFVSNFIERLIPKKIEIDLTALYLKLSREEQLRAYVATFNLMYLSSLSTIIEPEIYGPAMFDVDTSATAFNNILPPALAEKLRKLTAMTFALGDAPEITNLEQYRRQLSELEQALSMAREHLSKYPVEQIPLYQNEIERLEKNVDYSVKIYDAELAEANFGYTNLPDDGQLFIVETPLLIDLFLVRDEGRLKILTLAPVDGD